MKGRYFKNLISVFIALLLIMLTASASALNNSILSTQSENEDAELTEIKTKFTEKYKTDSNEILGVSKLYSHKDKNNKTDWVLLSALTNVASPSFVYAVLGNRIIRNNCIYHPFPFSYCVYDTESESFVDLVQAYKNQQYYELVEIVDSMKIGKLIGDMNNDDRISISDATALQKCFVNIQSFDKDDEIIGWPITKEIKFVSDFNQDGERDIRDVTAIQRYLAGL